MGLEGLGSCVELASGSAAQPRSLVRVLVGAGFRLRPAPSYPAGIPGANVCLLYLTQGETWVTPTCSVISNPVPVKVKSTEK